MMHMKKVKGYIKCSSLGGGMVAVSTHLIGHKYKYFNLRRIDASDGKLHRPGGGSSSRNEIEKPKFFLKFDFNIENRTCFTDRFGIINRIFSVYFSFVNAPGLDGFQVPRNFRHFETGIVDSWTALRI